MENSIPASFKVRTSRFYRRLLVALLLTVVSFAQQGKPDLSGTWKLNPKLSKFAQSHGKRSDLYKIKQKGSKLEITHVADGRNQTLSYVVDGKQRTVGMFPEEIKDQADWDGDILVIKKYQNIGSATIEWRCRYALSQNGNTLTMRNHVSKSAMSPEFDEELVYERQ